jgi:mannose-6-phosphate isomerase-like protein (cupin superfamily)
MVSELGPVRRVVTGIGEDGRSKIEEDGQSPSIKSVAERPGYVVSNLWVTGAAPSDVHAADHVVGHEGVSPPPGGSVIRVIDVPPEPDSAEELAAMMKASFGQLFDDADRSHNQSVHPGMHQTGTVDYAIVLAGEIYAVMDAEESLLKAGDILIQRGTNHAWSNRSGALCRLAFILIDANREA